MSIFKKGLYILSWIPMIFIKLSLVILGLVVVPLALMTRDLSLDKNISSENHWPGIFWLWGNDEEGCPAWWGEIALAKGGFIKQFPYFWWYAIRNPVNNFRFIFKDREEYGIDTNWGMTTPMEATMLLKANQTMAYRWIWSGLFAGYRKVWLNGDDLYSEIWFGWKVGSTVPGMGFTTQLRLNRDIGT